MRYYRAGEIEAIAKVEVKGAKVGVHLKLPGTPRFDRWHDLGGGLGYVPEDGVKGSDA